MRELQAIQAILDKVLLKAREDGARQITNIHLGIGEITEMDQNVIQRYWKDLIKDTLAEGAQLHFHVIAAEVQCMSCFQKYHPKDGEILCPYCGSMGAKILLGEEIRIESIELDWE